MKRKLAILLVCLLVMQPVLFTAFAGTATVSSLTALQSAIYNAWESKDPTLTVTYTGKGSELNSKSLATVFANALIIEDYVKYTNKGYSYSYTAAKTGSSTFLLNSNYWESASEVAAVSAKATEVVGQVTNASMNVHQKVKALHDWVVLNFAYDTTLKKHSAYAGITTGTTVCQGYALMMYRLLKTASIPVRIVEGKAGSQLHAWNLVQLDNKWYHLDATWDDPVPDVSGRLVYNYYLLSDTQIRQDHSPVGKYPAASTSYETALFALLATDTSRQSFYQQLITTLGLQYMQDANTIKSAAAMKTKVQQAIAGNQSTFTVRYYSYKNISKDLKTAFMGIYRGYSYSYTMYPKTTDPNDCLLTLTIK